MAEETASAPETEVFEGQPAAEPDAAAQMMDVKPMMTGLTWLSFGIVAIALAKVLWKPVLQGLEKREEGIQEALAAAEKSRAEVAGTRKQIREMQETADREARERVETATRQSGEILETARREAAESAEKRLREAERQIAVEREGAVAAVERESLRDLGSALERVLARKLTDEEKRAYQDDMLKELRL